MNGLVLPAQSESHYAPYRLRSATPSIPMVKLARHSGFNAGERDVSGSAFALRIQRRSTGSDCRSHDCPPKYCLCGSNRRTSYTGSPNRHFLCRSRSSRTRGPRRPPRILPMQEQRQPPRSCVSSSAISMQGLVITPRSCLYFNISWPLKLAIGRL
jgi:hypothetical protein